MEPMFVFNRIITIEETQIAYTTSFSRLFPIVTGEVNAALTRLWHPSLPNVTSALTFQLQEKYSNMTLSDYDRFTDLTIKDDSRSQFNDISILSELAL